MADFQDYLNEGDHEYEGVRFSKDFPPAVLDKIKKEVELDPLDVVIATYPKAGTTWMQEIVWLLYNNADTEKAKQDSILKRVPFLEMQMDSAEVIVDGAPLEHLADAFQVLKSQTPPRLVKTHTSFETMRHCITKSGCKVVFVYRNPKDNLVSYYHFYRMVTSYGSFKGSFEDFFELFKHKVLYNGDWFDYNLGWWENMKTQPNFYAVSFENLKRDLPKEIRSLAKFLEKEPTEDEIQTIASHCGFDSMQKNDKVNYSEFSQVGDMDFKVSKFMRKGQVGDWQNYFNEEQNNYIEELMKERVYPTGLNVEFML